jgi:hypothetical protein
VEHGRDWVSVIIRRVRTFMATKGRPKALPFRCGSQHARMHAPCAFDFFDDTRVTKFAIHQQEMRKIP